MNTFKELESVHKTKSYEYFNRLIDLGLFTIDDVVNGLLEIEKEVYKNNISLSPDIISSEKIVLMGYTYQYEEKIMYMGRLLKGVSLDKLTEYIENIESIYRENYIKSGDEIFYFHTTYYPFILNALLFASIKSVDVSRVKKLFFIPTDCENFRIDVEKYNNNLDKLFSIAQDLQNENIPLESLELIFNILIDQGIEKYSEIDLPKLNINEEIIHSLVKYLVEACDKNNFLKRISVLSRVIRISYNDLVIIIENIKSLYPEINNNFDDLMVFIKNVNLNYNLIKELVEYIIIQNIPSSMLIQFAEETKMYYIEDMPADFLEKLLEKIYATSTYKSLMIHLEKLVNKLPYESKIKFPKIEDTITDYDLNELVALLSLEKDNFVYNNRDKFETLFSKVDSPIRKKDNNPY